MTLRNTFVGADAHIGPLGSNEFAEDFHKDSAICGRTESSAPTGITKVFCRGRRLCRPNKCYEFAESFQFFAAACCDLSVSFADSSPVSGAILGCSHPQWEHFDAQLFGEADGGGGAAGGAVVDGDEKLCAAEHFAVAPEHAAGSIGRFENFDLVAGVE